MENCMKNITCCFTGHRHIPLSKRKAVVQRLKTELSALINNGYQFFMAGGALGFDTIAAQTVLDLKIEYPHIKLILILPCPNQTRGWNETDKQTYEYIKSRADKVVYTSQEYRRGCMHKRNRHLVDNSSVCICYLTEDTGGTAYTVNYAKSKGLTIINIA